MGHTHRYQLAFKKKNQEKSPSPESRVPETGSDPPFGSGRDSGRDKISPCLCKGFERSLYNQEGVGH